jgi:flagellar biosynthetic protein FliR
MVDLFGLTPAHVETFLLVWIRVTVMLFVFPIFSAPQIPQLVRVGFGLLVAFAIFHTVPLIAPSHDIGMMVAAVVSQVVLGTIVGFVASLVFVGVQFAGEVIDLQIGFAVANVISPQTQQQITIIGELELTLATLLFLATDSHLLLLQGIAGSFHLVPLPYINLDPSVMGNVVTFLSQALTIVFKIAAPAAVALFMVNVALAFMARVAPQMNVFVVGLPLQIGVGMVMLAISAPLLASVGPSIFSDIAREMDTVMRGLHA